MKRLLQRVYEAQSAENSRDNQELADYTVTAVLREVASYLEENDFISVNDRLPVLKDWDYASEAFIIVSRLSSGKLIVGPGRYERSIVRGKRVERWRDERTGYLATNVTHWKKYPEPPPEEPSENACQEAPAAEKSK